jgi:hypothetical protein
MHRSTKDHLLFACTKYDIKHELWFVHERDRIFYGFFHTLFDKEWHEDRAFMVSAFKQL